jgi:hypothetical protein
LIHEFLVIIRRLDTKATDAASVATGTQETWDFSGVPLTLTAKVDGGSEQTITFVTGDFATNSAATADEVVARIDADLTGGEAYKDASGAVVAGTDTTGDSGSIQITGGTANSILSFPTVLVSGGGYDDVFAGTKRIPDGTQEGLDSRRERPSISLRCQLDRNSWGQQAMGPGGLEKRSDIVIIVEREDLVDLSLLDSNGVPYIEAGDRIDKITKDDGTVMWAYPDPPGMFVDRVEPAGYGLTSDAEINLFNIHCSKRELGR